MPPALSTSESLTTVPRKGAQGALPRLAYMGGLAVEATSAGPAQLFRVLLDYPASDLRVIEVDCKPSQPERRLPGVRYDLIKPPFERGWYFTRMRLPRVFWAMLDYETTRQARLAEARLGDFRPEAILTVHEAFAWYSAAKLARRLQVPLHIILHDDWFRNIPMASFLKTKFETVFSSVYQSASGRFCISPYMEREYARRFGASGSVLYPIRAPQFAKHTTVGQRVNEAGRRLTVAYAGNLWHKGNWEALRNLVAALEKIGGNLVIFGPTKEDDVRKHGLAGKPVSVRGFVPDLIRSLREEAHVVFVAMTFEPQERRNMEVCFPSKMTEYTAAGLPVLIQGPASSSAIRWALENPDAAETVTEQSTSALEVGLRSLLDPERRARLALRALEVGHDCFSFEKGIDVLRAGLLNGGTTPTSR